MNYRKSFLVEPGQKLCLSQIDPSSKEKHETSETAVGELEDNRQKLTRLQALLYAEHKHSLLIVLQAMDAGGKDGTVNHVFAAFNAQGTTVTGFKQPTPVERDHDFLWRVHPHVPGPGKVAIFNPSHYEDVLITRVQKLIDEATCKARYEQIRCFERGLADNGTCILKFFLHISREEQLARFAERLQDPCATGRSARRTTPSGSCGTTTSPPSRTRWKRPARNTLPGSSSLLTINGRATSRSRALSWRASRSSTWPSLSPRSIWQTSRAGITLPCRSSYPMPPVASAAAAP